MNPWTFTIYSFPQTGVQKFERVIIKPQNQTSSIKLYPVQAWFFLFGPPRTEASMG